jgi:SAM-dependent methyltransferase
VTKRGSGAAPKRYDAEYFERWYRKSDIGVGQRQFVERKVRLALSAAEYVLGRPARSVLDVGCGEGPWRAILRRLRPGIGYLGIDSSAYAVARYGKSRNLRLGGLSDLARMRLAKTYDLIVCSDVLHYVSDDEARAGLAEIAPRVGGAAFLEAFTNADEIDGDHHDLQDRSPAAYHRLFAEAGLEPVGLHVYVTRERFEELVALEQGAARR